MRKRAKKDTTHNPIARALRDVGYTVADTSGLGDGFPDAVIGGVCRRTGERHNWLVEFKTGKGDLTPAETAFIETWRGPVAIIRTVDEAYRLVGVLE